MTTKKKPTTSTVKSPRDFWTPERNAELRKLASEGLTATQIGIKMGCTRNMVLGYMHRNKIELARRNPGRPMSDVKPSKYVRPRRALPVADEVTAASPRKTSSGNGRFNFRRAEELIKEPQTVGSWPKPENECSVLIADLQSTHCQMPLWDFIGPNSKFCGRPRLRYQNVTISPYCGGCHKLAYQPPR